MYWYELSHPALVARILQHVMRIYKLTDGEQFESYFKYQSLKLIKKTYYIFAVEQENQLF